MKFKEKNGLYNFIFCALPFIVMSALSIWKGFDLSKFTLVYNDEASWYGQVMAVVKYGRPLGYFGYNGSHAPIGTFGVWGISVTYLMALFPKLLSFFIEINESVIILSNLGWACLANGLFILLAKPNRGQIKALILLYLCLFVNHLYMFVAMAEILRYSMAMILAGMFCFLQNRCDHSKYRIMLYAVVPSFILISASAYVVFGALLPAWFYFIYKNNEKLSRHTVAYFIGTLILSLGIIFLIYIIINVYCASPYMEGRISSIIYAFGKGAVHGIKFTILSTLERFIQCSPVAIASSIGVDHGFISIQLFFYYAILISAVYSAVKNWKDSFRSSETNFIVVFVLVAWMSAFVVMYDITSWTLIRGLNVAVVFSLYFLLMTDIKVIRKTLIVALAGIIPFLMTFSESFISGRNDVGRTNMSKEFGEYIVIDEESKDPWENTVAYYGAYQKHGIDLPIGTGVNLMLYCGVNEKAKYAIVEDDHYIDTEKILQELQDHHHEIIFQEEDLVVLKNMSVN